MLGVRAMLVATVAAASLGLAAPSASAKCSPDADPWECFWMCTTAQLVGAACRS